MVKSPCCGHRNIYAADSAQWRFIRRHRLRCRPKTDGFALPVLRTEISFLKILKLSGTLLLRLYVFIHMFKLVSNLIIFAAWIPPRTTGRQVPDCVSVRHQLVSA